MLQELTTDVIDTILVNQAIGRIGCSANNEVLVEPMMYMYDGQFIYGHTREGTKINMLRQNPNACFEVDEMVSLHCWRSVIVHGIYEELTGDDRLDALRRLGDRTMPLFREEYPSPSGDSVHSPHSIVYRIRITSKTGRSETKNALRSEYTFP